MSLKNLPAAKLPFAAVRPGFKIGYSVLVDGQNVLSRGEVFSFRRIGPNRLEITLLHEKTGAFFTDEFRGNDSVIVYSEAFAIPGKKEERDELTEAAFQAVLAAVVANGKGFYAMDISD
jgi:hypothetical protein